MERAIRICKDFNVRWSIRKVVDGERQPYELAGKELVLQYRTPYGTLHEAKEWKVEGNIIVWTFRGKDQKELGSHGLILTENAGKDGMVTVDTCRAFKLVAHSCEETEGSGSDIVIEDVVLESEVAFAALRGPQGERGPEGPQGPQGERGPQGEQGPAGPSYNDTEIKAKLAELSAENERLKEELNNKIPKNADDYYPNISVGTADNLAGVDEVASEFTFRRSGGGAITDGVARVQSIKGNSVVWNQLYTLADSFFVDGVHFTANEDNSITLSGAPKNTYVNFGQFSANVAGHKYLFELVGANSLDGAKFALLNRNDNRVISNGYAAFIHANEDTTIGRYIGFLNLAKDSAVSETIYVRQIDLTKMFGAGNEPTTIEEFYKRMPMGVDLNAYNEGEVIHMDVQSIESVGVNQWDEEWELGRIDVSTGNNQALYDSWRSKNFTEVIPNAEYYIKGGALVRIVYYDKDFKFVDWWGCDPYKLATMPSNVRYVRLTQQNVTAYAGGISINISDPSINGKYYPYIKRQEDLSIIRKYFPEGMKSAGTAHDEIRYNKASGKWEKREIKQVDMGALKIAKSASTGIFYCEVPSSVMKDAVYGDNLLCARYATWKGDKATTSLPDKSIMLYNGASYPLLGINDSAYTDAESLKASLQGVILYYEPTDFAWEEIEEKDFNLDYSVWNCGTEQAIAEGKSSALAADITYGFNAIGKIKELESLVAALRTKVGI